MLIPFNILIILLIAVIISQAFSKTSKSKASSKSKSTSKSASDSNDEKSKSEDITPIDIPVPITPLTSDDVAKTTVYRENYLTMYKKSSEFCRKNGSNIVYNRHDNINLMDLPIYRSWSFHDQSYDVVNAADEYLPFCSSIESLLRSAELGYRKSFRIGCKKGSESSCTPETRYVFRSTGCTYKWYKQEELCEISSRFAWIGLHGDSVSRQVSQGYYMLMTDDLIYGALPKLMYPKKPEMWDNCRCDGQFSESLLCRGDGKKFNIKNSHGYGLCSAYPSFAFDYFDVIDPCFNDTRPRFLMLHFGMHENFEFNEAKDSIKEIMKKQEDLRNSCPTKYDIYYVWASEYPHHPKLDILYPLQATPRAKDFSRRMYNYIKTLPPESNFYFMNVTSIGINGATSDGYHPLSETHAIQVMHLMNMMDMLVPKKKSISKKDSKK